MWQQVVVVGRTGRSAELRYTPSGIAVVGFSVAANRRWSDKEGENHEKTVWFKVAAWGEKWTWLENALNGSRLVMVVGELEEPDVWEDASGKGPRASNSLRMQTIRMLESDNKQGTMFSE